MAEPRVAQFKTDGSGEISRKQLELARAQGDMYFRAVKEMIQNVAKGETRSEGDYMVGYVISKAEGFYTYEAGEIKWNDPHNENVHIKLIVADVFDGRFVPGLQVGLTIKDKNGNSVGKETHPFVWDPWLYHYGKNWRIATGEIYELHVIIEQSLFIRSDKHYGSRYLTPVTVTFPHVEIQI